MKKEHPVVNNEYLIEKFPGKGGWSYVAIPEISQDSKNPFGWVKVKGTIDSFEINQYKLMPMGNGRLFLPLKAEIRKKIGKQAGDTVSVTLFQDDTPLKIPDELMECFKYEPKHIYEAFQQLSEGRKKMYIDCIYSAKKEETKARRIAKLLESLSH